MKELSIENPCPVLLMRMKKSDDGFYCSSCARNVIDFRGKSDEEIKANMKAGACGIFDVAQLPSQQRMSVKRQLVFYSLAFLSLLGFNVQPAAAQTRDTTKTTLNQNGHLSAKEYREKKKELKKSKRSRSGIFRRKRRKHVTGVYF